MKKTLLTMLIALLAIMMPNIAWAQDFESDGIYYNVVSETDLTVEVTYKGDGSYQYAGSVDIPSTVANDSKEYTVVGIGESAFRFCSALAEITIPNSVTTIGNSAFEFCRALTEITIPNSVTTIGESAFSDCDALSKVDIPNSVTNIGKDAFDGCNLTDLTVSADNPNYSADGALLLNKDKTTLIACVNRSITSVSIPSTVTTIGKRAFYDCYNLAEITIPNSVTTIGESAFYACSALAEITIPNSVTNIGNGAFESCYNLTEITIPNSVINIGNGAFQFCSALAEITIPNSVTNIGNGAFDGCYSLAEITIPNSVINIGNGAFRFCSALTEITIPNSVTTIGESAFDGCYALTTVNYVGSETEWIDITIGYYNDYLTNATINYLPNDNDTTSINDVDAQGVNSNVVYNLKGCKVENPGNGVYIVNGKKVFIK